MKQLKNSSGQMSIEMVLMVVVLLAVIATVTSAFRSNEYFANLVTTPWQATTGLIQNGVWGKAKDTMSKHPHQFTRVNTVMGDIVE